MRNDFLSHASDPDPDDSNRLQLEAGAALCALDAADRPLRSGDRVLSTHWFDLTERELRFLGLLARQAADLIEYQQIACIAPIGRADATSISVEAVGTVFFNVQGRVNAANDTFLRDEPLQPGGVGAGGNARLK